MKAIFKCLALVFLAVPFSASAQDQDPVPRTGFVRLVNAVAPGTGPLFFEVDGENLNPDGYNLGDVTGGVSLKPGSHDVKIRREGTKDGSTKVNVALNETTILIPFAEKVPASDTEPAHWAIRILRLKQLEPLSDRSATFVSVSQNPELKVEMRDPDGKWNSSYVKRLAISQLPINYPRGYVPVKIGETQLEPIPVADVGNYVVLLYDDPEGKTRSLSFRDYKFLSAD